MRIGLLTKQETYYMHIVAISLPRLVSRVPLYNIYAADHFLLLNGQSSGLLSSCILTSEELFPFESDL